MGGDLDVAALADKSSKREASLSMTFVLHESRKFMKNYYSFSYSPIHDETGKVAGCFALPRSHSKSHQCTALRTLSELSAGALTKKRPQACASVGATLSRIRTMYLSPFFIWLTKMADGSQENLRTSS